MSDTFEEDLKAALKRCQQHAAESYFQDHESSKQWQINHPLLTLDFSRHCLDWDVFAKLWHQLKNNGFITLREQLFEGNYTNRTEQRSQWHIQSRRPKGQGLIEIEQPLLKLKQWVERCHLNQTVFKNQQGPIQHVLYLGCGGSEIGQRLLCDVAKHYTPTILKVDFISSIDSDTLHQAFHHYDPKKTIVVMASKSFKTIEVLKNARKIQAWMCCALEKEAVKQRFFAITSQPEKAIAWGVDSEHIFEMPESLSGRFSLWSTMGAAIALSAGWEAFEALRQGAFEMDQHWLSAPWQQNAPIILGLLSYWYRQVCGYQTHGIIPYAEMLQSLPTYLQQLSMESLGKVSPQQGQSGPVIFGGAGTGAQHTFFQWLHQSQSGAPIDMIACFQPQLSAHDNAFLWANCVAQADLLFKGQAVSWPKQLPGARASSIIWIKKPSLAGIGALLALYEHQIFVESVLYDVNPFDQFGVEAGKCLAQQCQQYLEKADTAQHEHFQPASLLKQMSAYISLHEEATKDKVN